LSKGQTAEAPWNDKALQAVFSEDVLKDKRNTAAIEVAPSTLLAARVTEYQPATVRAFADASSEILEKLKKQQATESVLTQGKMLLEQLRHGEKVSVSWKTAKTVNRNQRNEIAPELLEAVFRADISKLPAYVGTTTQNGYALARIDAVKETASVDEGKRDQMVRELRQLTGEELLTAYLVDARKRADITMKDFTAEEKK
jgi:peptidyl-prolyl cis-trans isomerase D